MPPLKLTALFVGLLSASIGLFFELRFIARQDGQLRTLQVRANDLARQTTELRANSATAARELTELETELTHARSMARAAASIANTPLAIETASWLARLHRLKQLLNERPEHCIPELALLSDRELLILARQVSFETEADLRQSLARVRTAAKQKLTMAMGKALRSYRDANNGQPPATLEALIPFFTPPLASTLLHGWKILPTEPNSRGTQHLISEKSAVDEDYDSRILLQANSGYAILSPPGAWIPNYYERMREAHQAFQRANSGANAPDLARLLPYFNPPLDPSATDRVLKAERDLGK